MAYLEELKQNLDSNTLSALGQFKVTMFSNLLLVEGYKGVANYTASQVRLRLSGKKCMVIYGENFNIKYSNKDEINICGKINKIEVEE